MTRPLGSGSSIPREGTPQTPMMEAARGGEAEPSAAWVDRFWQKVNRGDGDGCWLWTASLHQGYGHFALSRSVTRAHRIAYELLMGPIPEGLQLDHLCRNRACVNPAHLEPVTLQENLRRGRGTGPATEAAAQKKRAKQTCQRGHEFTPENTRLIEGGYRRCRTCARLNKQRFLDRHKATGTPYNWRTEYARAHVAWARRHAPHLLQEWLDD